MARVDIKRRPESPEDADFRFALFCVSRQPFECLVGLEPALAAQLMRQQFAGQEASYRSTYPDARHDIVEVDGTPVGRIVVDEGRAAWTIVDIAIAGAWRGTGIGTRLIEAVIAAARAAGRPVRLRVMAGNGSAARLYERLGFVVSETTGMDVGMVWHPPTDVGSDTHPSPLRRSRSPFQRASGAIPIEPCLTRPCS